MKILLSIKPTFVEKIFSGEKKYEYRRKLYKNRNLKTIVVYSSSPIRKVVGEIEVEEILSDSPEKLWSLTKCESGITENYFRKYFDGRNVAYAIKIKSYNSYDSPVELNKKYPGVRVPQSFCYVGE